MFQCPCLTRLNLFYNRQNLSRLLILLFLSLSILPASSADQIDDQIIYVGVVNKRANNKQYDLNQYSKLIAYIDRELKKTTHLTAKITFARDLGDLASKIKSGKVSILMESVMSTLRMEKATGKIKPELLGWRKGQREYYSVFFARKDSPINTLNDMKGHSIAFEAQRSTSAFIVPLAALQQNGLVVSSISGTEGQGDDVRFVFAGTELNQAYWVYNKRVDAGAFNNGDWERLPKGIKKNLKIFHETRPILRWIISFNTALDPEVKATLTEILTHMDQTEEGKSVLKVSNSMQKIEPLTNDDHKNLEYWKNTLKEVVIKL